VSIDQPAPLPDSTIEDIIGLAFSLGEPRPEGLAYVLTTERQALQLALGYVPVPPDRAGLDDAVYLVSLQGRFTAPHTPLSKPRRTGSFLRLIIDGSTYQRRGLSIGDEPLDLRTLGSVLLA
jgi:hypothetical protein